MPLPLAKIIASSLGLVAFAVAVIAGLHADNPADSILLRALTAMIVCYISGLVVGRVFEHIVRVHLRKIDAATKKAISDAEASDEAEAKAIADRRAAAVAAGTQQVAHQG